MRFNLSNNQVVEFNVYHSDPWNTTRTTTVEVVLDGQHTYTGQALNHPNDSFVRKTGRKIAFDRAVRQIENRELRKELWHTFLNWCKI